MKLYPKISLITPNKNSGKFLEACIQSVLNQNYPNLEYIIIDGASTDNSLEIIERYNDQITLSIIEPDNGTVEAINKGFAKSSGEIMAWLNSDDLLHPGALHKVGEIFSTFEDVEWLMGLPSYFDENGVEDLDFFINQELTPRPLYFNQTMFRAWARWSKHRYYNGDILAIQQESTFWRRSLWEKAGGKLNPESNPAFDFDLWLRFFDHAQLYSTNVKLGGFRYHSDQQLSIKNRQFYLEQCHKMLAKKRAELKEGELKNTKQKWELSKLLRPFFYFNIPVLREKYRNTLEIPPIIKWSEDKQKLCKSPF